MIRIAALIFCCFVMACGGDADSPATADPDLAPSLDDATPQQTAPAPIATGAPTPEAPLAEDEKIVEVDMEAVSERAQNSAVASEACCADLAALQQCCCDKVLKKYEGHLIAEEFEAAMGLSGTDAYYKLCTQQFGDFEQRIIDLEDKHL